MADPFADDDAFNPLSQARAPDATPPQAPPTSPAPDTGGQSRRIEQLLSQGQGHIDQAEKSMNAESNIYQDKTNALAPVRQKMMDLAAQPLPQPPQMKNPPAAPKRSDQHDDETWLMASALLGSLAGAFTRRHQTNALAAFTGAMQGYNEGSREKFDQNMKIWEAENKSALEKNQQAMEHYRSIIENRKLTLDQMSVSLQMAAAQYDDQAMATAARTKNEIVIAQLYDKQAEAAQKAKTSSDKLSEQYQGMKQREWKQQAEQWVNSPEGSAVIQGMIDYKRPPPPTNTRTGAEAERNNAIWAALYQRTAGGYDAGKFARDQAVQKQQALIPGRAEAAAETSAARIGAAREEQLKIILATARPNLEMSANSLRKLDETTFVPLNRLEQIGLQNIGDPDIREFFINHLKTMESVARAMNPQGQLTKYALDEVKEVMDRADSPEAYYRALQTINSWMDREMNTIRDLRAGRETPAANLGPAPHSTGVDGAAGAVQRKEDELRERAGIGGQRLFDQGEFQPRALIPEWLQTPKWLRDKIYVPPSERQKPTAGGDMTAPGLPPGWKVEEVK